MKIQNQLPFSFLKVLTDNALVRDTLTADDPFAPPSHDPNHYVNSEITFHFVLVSHFLSFRFFCVFELTEIGRPKLNVLCL